MSISFAPRTSSSRGTGAACLVLLAAGILGLSPVARGQVPTPVRMAPTQRYFNLFGLYYDGEYRDALKEFLAEGRGSIKNGPGNHWIDSICYHTMAAECYYQLGQLDKALEHYNSALQLFATYSDWMIRVQFLPSIRATTAGRIQVVPWGQSQRAARLGQYPETTLIGQGRLNNIDQVRQGGVVQPPLLYSIAVEEVVRCTTLAMRRRRELMGPACPVDPLTGQLITVLSRRPTLPNHWSEAYIDVQLGLAYAAAGKDAQARNVLVRSLAAGGEFDHPLTSTALLELGRLALKAGDYATAETMFAEATYSAVQYNDPGVLDDAFRYGLLTHLVANRGGPYPPLALAIQWARKERLRPLQASLLVMTAENSCMLGQPKPAEEALNQARSAMARSDLPASRLGARLNYTLALSQYQQGNASGGDAALSAAMDFQKMGSLWLFQMGLADSLWLNKGISDRVAMELYNDVLRDPTPADWAGDPLESLSSLMAPHQAIMEHWFEVALGRNEHERAMEIADLTRRHRFLNSLELGGRLLNLRWLLEGPPEMLSQQARLQRQNLLMRYPAYDQLAGQVRRLREPLLQSPLVPAAPEAARQQAAALKELASLSQSQEVILREIALRREPCDMVFPPRRTAKEVQQALGERQALLSFYFTRGTLFAFLMTHDQYGYWPVGSAAALPKQVKLLLREWGNYEQNKEISLEDLQSDRSTKLAREVLDVLMKDSRANLAQIADELVIVPDGLLWYVPFEALQLSDSPEPLITRLRVRYAPLVSLAVADPRPPKQGQNTAVVLGRLYPRDGADVAEAAFEDLVRTVPGAVAIRGPLPAPAAVYASLFDRLLVYSDLAPAEGGAFNWSPMPVDRASAGSALGHWFALPWGGPQQVVLPGFHTAAESSLKRGTDKPGDDLFLSICGLMATGARTVLISRWRAGGQSSYDLVREFTQELPHSPAAEAWQRSVLLVSDTPLNPDLEPRLKSDGITELPKANHPFFWAGFLLADTGGQPQVLDQPGENNVLVAKKKPAGRQPAPADGNDVPRPKAAPGAARPAAAANEDRVLPGEPGDQAEPARDAEAQPAADVDPPKPARTKKPRRTKGKP